MENNKKLIERLEDKLTIRGKSSGYAGLAFIGLGVDNTDILRFTDMSKRTYYKRRQLIAQRMDTSAAQLDELAKQLFTSE